MERIVSDIPAPTGDVNAPLKALIFDSYYDQYKGVITYFRVVSGYNKNGYEYPLNGDRSRVSGAGARA